MRTVEKMIAYVDEHGMGKGMTKGWRKRHFRLAAEQLNSDEEVLTCFIGMHNYISPTNHNSYYAYVITNNRFIMAQDKLIGNNLQIVSRKHLNDVHKTTGMMWGKLTFDTFKETFNVGVDKGTIDNIYSAVSSILFSEGSQASTNSDPKPQSPAKELIEFKELLDLGIITQEEFNKKKDEVLG